MSLVRHPSLRTTSGPVATGIQVTAVTDVLTNTDAVAYADDAGITPVTYPVTSGLEGEVDIWVESGTYESTLVGDSVDNPGRWEAASGTDVQLLRAEALNPMFREFGVTFDGSTNDTAGWEKLRDAVVGVDGAKIRVPAAGVSIIGQIEWPIDSIDLVFEGGGSKHGGDSSCELRSNYGGSGAIVKANGARGLRWEGISIRSVNAAFSGRVLDLSGGDAAGAAGDTTLWTVKNCALYAIAQAGSAVNVLQLTDATIGEIEDVVVYGGKFGIEGLTQVGEYTNAVTIGKGCLFNKQDVAALHNLGDGCVVGPNVAFEPLFSGAAGMYLQDATIPAGAVLLDWNWTGDSNGTGTWITFNGTRLDLRGRVDGGGTGLKLNATTRALQCSAHFNGSGTGIDLNNKTVNVLDLGATSFADSMATKVTGWAAGSGESGAGYYSALGAVQAILTTTHSIPHATLTAIPFDAVNYQTTGNEWAIGTPTRLTCRVPGLYRIYATAVFDVDAVGNRGINFKLNGATFLPGGTQIDAKATGNEITVVSTASSRFLNVGDYVECLAYQESSGALNVRVSDSGTGAATGFGMERVG